MRIPHYVSKTLYCRCGNDVHVHLEKNMLDSMSYEDSKRGKRIVECRVCRTIYSLHLTITPSYKVNHVLSVIDDVITVDIDGRPYRTSQLKAYSLGDNVPLSDGDYTSEPYLYEVRDGVITYIANSEKSKRQLAFRLQQN